MNKLREKVFSICLEQAGREADFQELYPFYTQWAIDFAGILYYTPAQEELLLGSPTWDI